MKTREILDYIESNGGFDNFNNWNRQEIEEWVYYNFECSKYVARKVSFELI